MGSSDVSTIETLQKASLIQKRNRKYRKTKKINITTKNGYIEYDHPHATTRSSSSLGGS
jgi:hypothetical protein